MKPNALAIAAFSLATLVAALPAQASYSWNLATAGTAVGSSYGNTRTYSGSPSGAPSVTASAWSNTVGSANVQIDTAYLGSYSGGLGVSNRDEGINVSAPNHAMDNDGNNDSILFSFSSSVVLERVDIGWPSSTSTYDSDITVLAYMGAGVPTLLNNSYGNLVASGWQVIGNYCDLKNTGFANVNAGGQSSSYWLIAAYNSTFGNTCIDQYGQTKSCSTAGTSSFDYVKVSMLTAKQPTTPPQGVPEPTTLLLFGAGLLGLVKARRK